MRRAGVTRRLREAESGTLQPFVLVPVVAASCDKGRGCKRDGVAVRWDSDAFRFLRIADFVAQFLVFDDGQFADLDLTTSHVSMSGERPRITPPEASPRKQWGAHGHARSEYATSNFP